MTVYDNPMHSPAHMKKLIDQRAKMPLQELIDEGDCKAECEEPCCKTVICGGHLGPDGCLLPRKDRKRECLEAICREWRI